MSTVHEQARTMSGSNEPNGMTIPPQASLAQFRKEFFDLVEAIVLSSNVLEADTRELDQEKFRKDVHAMHSSSGRLRDMAQEFCERKPLPQSGRHSYRGRLARPTGLSTRGLPRLSRRP